MGKPKYDTYKVTMPDGEERSFAPSADRHVTPLQFVQGVAQLINDTGKSAFGCKIQREKASK